MKNTVHFLLGFLTYLGISFIIFGYGHLTSHVQLNEIITTKFIDNASTNANFARGKFKNYEFNWNNSAAPLLTGPAFIGEAYIFEPSEEDKDYMPSKWIAEGGWMEDEPWGPAALRHFYDPLGIDNGKHYLTDRATYIEHNLIPLTIWLTKSAKDWATSSDNIHGWEKAKYHVVEALKSDQVDKKEENMAKAYRYLGQSLHLIADMGCPPHVRNDSHPPNPIYSYFGDPDPYEDLCKLIDARQYVSSNIPDYELVEKFKIANKYEDIFEELASFTNENLPTNHTISTDRINPLIRPNNPYPSPYLTDINYNKTTYTFIRDNVKMCKDKVPTPSWWGFLTGIDSLRGRPYVDFECVKSQAAFIMPNIAEAGVNVIRNFIPSLAIEITEAKIDSGGIIRGRIKIETIEPEYSNLFDLNNIYNGEAKLLINNVQNSIAVYVVNNNFEIKLNGFMPNLSTNDKAKVSIEFGGIVLKSEEVNFTDTERTVSEVQVTINGINLVYQITTLNTGVIETDETLGGFTAWSSQSHGISSMDNNVFTTVWSGSIWNSETWNGNMSITLFENPKLLNVYFDYEKRRDLYGVAVIDNYTVNYSGVPYVSGNDDWGSGLFNEKYEATGSSLSGISISHSHIDHAVSMELISHSPGDNASILVNVVFNE